MENVTYDIQTDKQTYRQTGKQNELKDKKQRTHRETEDKAFLYQERRVKRQAKGI